MSSRIKFLSAAAMALRRSRASLKPMTPLSIAYLPPHGPFWLFAIVGAALAFHVAAGGVGILSGYAAIKSGEFDLGVVLGFDKHPRGAFNAEAR